MINRNHFEKVEIFWTDQGKSSKRECSLEVHLNDIRHRYFIQISSVLRLISLQMLKAADKLGVFRLDYSYGHNNEQVLPSLQDNKLWEIAPPTFMKARRKVFKGIIDRVSDESGNGLGITEACDLMSIAEDI